MSRSILGCGARLALAHSKSACSLDLLPVKRFGYIISWTSLTLVSVADCESGHPINQRNPSTSHSRRLEIRSEGISRSGLAKSVVFASCYHPLSPTSILYSITFIIRKMTPESLCCLIYLEEDEGDDFGFEAARMRGMLPSEVFALGFAPALNNVATTW